MPPNPVLWFNNRMPIFNKFKNLSGPLAALAAQREEIANQEESGSSEEPRFHCRICGHQDLQGSYCTECLAETMEPLDPKKE